MPLIVISGLPSSGKTTRANELEDLFKRHCPDKEVHLVSDDYSIVSKNQLYSSSKEEKTGRASLKSKVERLLTKDAFVILDSLNYIKGFRYELYCISKHMKTTHCIVQCDTPPDTARSWNIARKVEEQYTTEVFDGLLMRFEAPDSRNRWDSPLIVLYPNDPLPDNGIIDVLIHRKPPPPNQSTQTQPLSSVDFLHELDRQTQTIIIKILELQKQGLLTGKSAIPGTAEQLTIHSDVTMAELRRLRHQFITYTKMHPFEGVEKISTLFVQYLNNSL